MCPSRCDIYCTFGFVKKQTSRDEHCTKKQNQMRVAVLCTGKLRTFADTHALIRKNMLEPLESDVFMFLDETEESISKAQVHESWPQIRRIELQSEHAEYIPIRNWVLQKIDRLLQSHEKWVLRYLSNGGSLLEYYQLYRCMQLMLSHESDAKIHYDVIIRTRCDTVLLYPLRSVQDLFSAPHDNLQTYLLKKPPTNPSKSIPEVYTVRKNCVWVAKRSAALLLSNIIFHYGNTKPTEISANWWDSETQFQSFMSRHGITFVDYFDDLLDQYIRSRSKNASAIQNGVVNHDLPPELAFTAHRPLNYDQFIEE